MFQPKNTKNQFCDWPALTEKLLEPDGQSFNMNHLGTLKLLVILRINPFMFCVAVCWYSRWLAMVRCQFGQVTFATISFYFFPPGNHQQSFTWLAEGYQAFIDIHILSSRKFIFDISFKYLFASIILWSSLTNLGQCTAEQSLALYNFPRPISEDYSISHFCDSQYNTTNNKTVYRNCTKCTYSCIIPRPASLWIQ